MKVSSTGITNVARTMEVSSPSSITKSPPKTPELNPSKLEPNDQMLEQFQKMIEFVMRLLEMLIEGAKANSAAATKALSNGLGGSGGVSNEFLWKPSSEKNGNLVVLLPSNLTGKVSGIEVKAPNGRTIEGGKFSGVHNGGREHFRFSKPGASFPAGSEVHIHLKDGNTKVIQIANPGSRVTK